MNLFTMDRSTRTTQLTNGYVIGSAHDENVHLFNVLELITLLSILLLSIIANCSLLIAILRSRRLRRNNHNLLVLNLIVFDLFSTFGSMTVSLIDLIYPGFLLRHPLLCRIHGTIALLGCFGNYATVALISMFRCFTVLADGRIAVKRYHVVMIMASGCIVSVAMVFPPASGIASKFVYTPGTHHCSPSWQDSCFYYTTSLALGYCVTVPSMIISYVLITLKVKKSSDRVRKLNAGDLNALQTRAQSARDLPTQSSTELGVINDCAISVGTNTRVDSIGCTDTDQKQRGTDQRITDNDDGQTMSGELSELRFTKLRKKHLHHRHEKQVAFAGVLLVLTTSICWTPYAVIHNCNHEPLTENHWLEVSTMWLGYLNAALDPIIYTVFNEKIRRSVFKQFRQLWSMLSSLFKQ
ncbi:uncharacterized protein [Apostichopus japonicus]|uniref:uncharacterized protein n=1 Tax=Stichopus japonicus TaxID=307972 RepID=UPI003AB8A035